MSDRLTDEDIEEIRRDIEESRAWKSRVGFSEFSNENERALYLSVVELQERRDADKRRREEFVTVPIIPIDEEAERLVDGIMRRTRKHETKRIVRKEAIK